MRGAENRRQHKRSFMRRGSKKLGEEERDIYALRLIDRQVRTKRDGEGEGKRKVGADFVDLPNRKESTLMTNRGRDTLNCFFFIRMI